MCPLMAWHRTVLEHIQTQVRIFIRSLLCICLVRYFGWRTQGPVSYPIRRLIVRSRKVSKARDWVLKCSYGFENLQAHRQQCCRGACKISERSDNYEYKSRGFGTLQDLRRLIGYWNRALVSKTSVTINWDNGLTHVSILRYAGVQTDASLLSKWNKNTLNQIY